MRHLKKTQLGLFSQYPNHQLSTELQQINNIIDRHPEFAHMVHEDLVKEKKDSGDIGMTSEQVLKVAILKSIRGLSYRALAFNLVDSVSTRAFLGLELEENYAHSTLQDLIVQISEETWGIISASLVSDARDQKIEPCKKMRLDSTVTKSNIHHPTDASLLYDCIRVTEREFKKVRKNVMKDFWRLISREDLKRAKTLLYKINNSKNDAERLPCYKELLKIATKLNKGLPDTIRKIKKEQKCVKMNALKKSLKQLENVAFYLEKIIFQTQKRVIKGKKVSSEKKVLSIFEPHTDIIVKGQREVEFGHKIFLTSGQSNMILDCQIPDGNPAESDMFLKVMNSVTQTYGACPVKVSADGGFASKENLEEAKEMGAKDVCFPEKKGMKILKMVKSAWVFKNLLNWRAGIEAVISFLKRCFGMRVAYWKGHDGFKRYVKNAVCAYNFVVLARHELSTVT